MEQTPHYFDSEPLINYLSHCACNIMQTRFSKCVNAVKQSSNEPTSANSSVSKGSSAGNTTIANVHHHSGKVGVIAVGSVNNATAAATLPKVGNLNKRQSLVPGPGGSTSSSITKASSASDSTIADVNYHLGKVGVIADGSVNNATTAATVPKVRNPHKKQSLVPGLGGATSSSNRMDSSAGGTTIADVNHHLGNVNPTTSSCVTSVPNITGMYDCCNVFLY